MIEEWKTETQWKTGTDYFPDDKVTIFDITYVCVKVHKSNVFANDFFDKGYWKKNES